MCSDGSKSSKLYVPNCDVDAVRLFIRFQHHPADDTPVRVLVPGTGKTKNGRLYLRDEWDWTGDPHPAAFYKITSD